MQLRDWRVNASHCRRNCARHKQRQVPLLQRGHRKEVQQVWFLSSPVSNRRQTSMRALASPKTREICRNIRTRESSQREMREIACVSVGTSSERAVVVLVTPTKGNTARTISMSESTARKHTSELQSRSDLVCRLLLEKKKKKKKNI